MTDEEYKETMSQVATIGAIVADLDLTRARDIANHARDFGHFVVAPMQWQRGVKNCEDALALLYPLIEFQKAVRKIRSRATSEITATTEERR